MRITRMIRPRCRSLLASRRAPTPRRRSKPEPPSELNIVRLCRRARRSWRTPPRQAWQGRREGRLFFNDGSGGEGEEFARLTLDGASLLAKPDGTPFAPGECVQITMALDDPTQILVRLEPGGLRFRPRPRGGDSS